MLAAQAIRAGDADVIVAGGMESMSRAPFLISGAREGWKFGDQQALDSMLHDGLVVRLRELAMGAEADYIADSTAASAGTTRTCSPSRATAAPSQPRPAGKFDAEIVPVVTGGQKGKCRSTRTKGRGADTSLEVLARLKPSFGTDGTVTAGNASQISDGAAAAGRGQCRRSPGQPLADQGADRGRGHQRRRAEGDLHRAGLGGAKKCWTRRS